MDDMKCAPMSDFIVAGTPNLEIQVEMKALTQTSIEMENKGTALDIK